MTNWVTLSTGPANLESVSDVSTVIDTGGDVIEEEIDPLNE